MMNSNKNEETNPNMVTESKESISLTSTAQLPHSDTVQASVSSDKVKEAKPKDKNKKKKKNKKYRKDDYETRYEEDGTRWLCVAIPYRINDATNSVELMMITSRSRNDWIFPGGGWEIKETREDAAKREAKEEAGIVGDVEHCLLSQPHDYESDKGNKSKIWFFVMHVTGQQDKWEENTRKRKFWPLDEIDDTVFTPYRFPKFGKAFEAAKVYFGRIQDSLRKTNETTHKEIKKPSVDNPESEKEAALSYMTYRHQQHSTKPSHPLHPRPHTHIHPHPHPHPHPHTTENFHFNGLHPQPIGSQF